MKLKQLYYLATGMAAGCLVHTAPAQTTNYFWAGTGKTEPLGISLPTGHGNRAGQ